MPAKGPRRSVLRMPGVVIADARRSVLRMPEAVFADARRSALRMPGPVFADAWRGALTEAGRGSGQEDGQTEEIRKHLQIIKEKQDI